MHRDKLKVAQQHASTWLEASLDPNTRADIEALLTPGQEEPLVAAFFSPLKFGTGGLRAKMGTGCSYMNPYSVALATQGLSNYLLAQPKKKLRAVIAYDSRLQSHTFAQATSEVFSAHGIEVYIFSALRPTPLLSFAVRRLQAALGIVITASHNPKEYNGYKVYGPEGGQLTSPADTEIMKAIAALPGPKSLRLEPQAPIQRLGKEMDEAYLQSIMDTLQHYGLLHTKKPQLRCVYSPLHGTGATLLPQLMQRLGYRGTQFQLVAAQAQPDGHFPTVTYPNPEEKSALAMAIKQATATDAALVMATDPDADRLGIAIQDSTGTFIPLSGNQIAALMLDFLLRYCPKPPSKALYVVKTIVTSELIRDIASQYGVACYDTLTGFKYIAQEIEARSAQETFLLGTEESYGYLIGDQVRDKDAISAAAVVALMAEEAAQTRKSLWHRLQALYLRFGLYEESLRSLTKEGTEGQTEIENIMKQWRKNPPTQLDGHKLERIADYQAGYIRDLNTQEQKPTPLPCSNVLQFFTKEAKISLRPSGTEPKIKAYFSLRAQISDPKQIEPQRKQLQQKIKRLQKQLMRQ